MKHHAAFMAIASLLLYSGLCGSADAQILFEEQFEGPFPGPVSGPPPDGGFGFFGGSGIPGGTEGNFFSQEITGSGGPDGSQSYQFSFDGSPNDGEGGFTFGGFGLNLLFGGIDFGIAGGAPGANNPANYLLSYDVLVTGNVENGGPGISTPLGVEVVVEPQDFNGDGVSDDNVVVWENRLEPQIPLNQTDFITVSQRLDEFVRPPLADPQVPEPFFTEEAFFRLRFEFNNGGFGNDAGNSINIDNLRFEFIAPVEGAGDFDLDGDTDGADFLEWQRSIGTPEALAEWQQNFGAPLGASGASLSAVPEPSAMVLALLVSGLAMASPTRRSGR